jgi:CheY-like chemotaxis protein
VDVEGPVGSVEDALRAIDDDGSFDGVLLDANLRGEPAGEIAAALTRRNIPFVFVTGYGASGLARKFRPIPDADKAFYPRAITTNGSTACENGAAWPAPAQRSRAAYLTGGASSADFSIARP